MDTKIVQIPIWMLKIRRANYFSLLVVFLICGLVCLLALRHNNATMVKLRSDVYTADKNGGDVNVALNRLRSYVYGHMNTNLASGTGVYPPIQLEYTYDRLATAAEQKANQAGLYTEAENYCQALIPASVSISGRGRISCVQDYILSHGGNKPAAIPASLYEFDFVSPAWSPDLAGWSLVATIISAAALAGRLLLNLWHKNNPR
jgi:hypothetical protein